jgi:hypothetical protein
MSEVTITVSGPVGSGKSALCKEIEILCRALGVRCEWRGGREERNGAGGDSADELELYKPTVTLHETYHRHDMPTEPTARGDYVAELMRQEYEAKRPKGWFARRRERRALNCGAADNLMIALLNIATRHYP